MDSIQSEYPWFAVMVKSRHEKAVAAALRGKGYSTYLPLCRRVRRYARHTRVSEVPLFPNYVFSGFDSKLRLPVLTIPGVFTIVSNGEGPVPLSTEELKSVSILCESGLEVGNWPIGQVGDRVLVVDGPLSGVTGTLAGIKNRNRLVVSVTLLQRAIAVDIDRAWVRPCSGNVDSSNDTVQ